MSLQANFGPVDNRESKESLLRTLPYSAVQITAGFWANYQQINRTASISHGFSMLEKAGKLRFNLFQENGHKRDMREGAE